MDGDDLVDELCQAIDRYNRRHKDLTLGEIFEAFEEIETLLKAEKIQLHRTH